jgi:methylenetetrahydrofolate reductase (NADPH)
MMIPLAEALRTRPFSIVVELVASGLKREAQVLEIASHLATVPDVVAGSITSYAGGRFGQDPLRVGTAVRARGLPPNVHLTCVNRDRAAIRKTLRELRALGIFNIFALTGDWPTEKDATPVFDLDSVQLTELIAKVRAEEGVPFHVAVAVSPFKYQREDLLYQYLKLEKKVAAGADLAITQVGWDARKFVELKRVVDERGLKIPLLGNVYVLGRRAAEKMAQGTPPGCWVSPELLGTVQRESEAEDGGLAARLERAAKTVAFLKGLGYAGAYIGGTHSAEQITHIINRARELEPQWEQCAAALQFGDPKGFYLDAAGAPPQRSRGMLPMVLDAAGAALPLPWAKDTRETPMRRTLQRFFAWVDSRPALRNFFERFEYWGKRPVFGCEACGNCVLGHMEYVCPQTCPKQMRNGPCGGTLLGRCEVVDQECIWVSVYSRAEAVNRVADLATFIPAADRRLSGTSSWINFYLNRDSRPGHPRPVDSTTAPKEPIRAVRNVRSQPPAAVAFSPERERTRA